LEAVPGKHSIDSLQKTAVLGTSHIIRKVLQCEALSLSGGDHRWFKRSTRIKGPVTRDIHIYNNNNDNNNDDDDNNNNNNNNNNIDSDDDDDDDNNNNKCFHILNLTRGA